MQRVSIKSGIHGTTYFFNTTLKESHSFTNNITQNPVQEGAYVNDHIYQQPITFTADIGESDCMGSTSSSFSSSKQAFAALETMWKEVDPLIITTEFSQYKDMLIESFNVSRDYKTMNAMKATVIFKQLIVTKAVEISISQKKTSYPQTTGKTNLGAKSGTISTKYKTIQIAGILYRGATATYNGKSMSLEDYFRKYSSSQSKFTSGAFGGSPYPTGDYTITPIISSAITNNTKITINYDYMDYDKFINTYKKK